MRRIILMMHTACPICPLPIGRLEITLSLVPSSSCRIPLAFLHLFQRFHRTVQSVSVVPAELGVLQNERMGQSRVQVSRRSSNTRVNVGIRTVPLSDG